MPTQQKVDAVASLKEKFEGASIVISTDYTGMSVTAMTAFRRALRQQGVEYRVIKNSLAYLAADEANMPLIKEIVQGPSGIALGAGDPTEPARALVDFIKANRSPMTIRGGLLDDRALSAEEVGQLASLPPKDRLLALLMGQLLAPLTSLAYVLNAPLAGLATVLTRRGELLAEDQSAEPEPAPEPEPVPSEVDPGPPDAVIEDEAPAEATAEAVVSEVEDPASADEGETEAAEEPVAAAEDDSGAAEPETEEPSPADGVDGETEAAEESVATAEDDSGAAEPETEEPSPADEGDSENDEADEPTTTAEDAKPAAE